MRVLIFGLGYTARRFAARVRAEGGEVVATRRGAAADALAFDDAGVPAAIAAATHILSSVPPDANGEDPVLARYGDALRAAPATWLGYLSSTGVYGDTGGAWVDESAPVGGGRRDARTRADLAWQSLRPEVRVFRLPGIYGPGRSALDRVRDGTATRVDAPGHVFSRVHVDDICATLAESARNPAKGVFNIADTAPISGDTVVLFASILLQMSPPPLVPLAEARLSPMARSFYSETRRIAARRIGRDLGVRLLYPDYRQGLRACLEELSR